MTFLLDPNSIKKNILRILSDGSLTRERVRKLVGISVTSMLSNPDIRSNFKREELERKLQEVIQHVAEHPQAKRNEVMDRELENLESYFCNEMGEWLILVPIDNLSLKAKSLRIGNVRLFNFDATTRTKIRKIYWNILKNNPHYSLEWKQDYIQWEEEHLLKRLEGKACGEFRCRGRLDNVHERAIEEVSNCLKIIKFYSFSDYEFTGRSFSITGEIIYPSVVRIFVRYRLDRLHADSYLERVGPLFAFELDSERIAFMRRNGLEKLNIIMSKDTQTGLEQRLMTSIYWFSEALEAMISIGRERFEQKPESRVQLKLGDSLVKLVMALESLLILNGEEPISNTLAERVAFLLGRDYEQRLELKSFLKQMYDLRSKVVHRGLKVESRDEIKRLTYITYATILRLIKNRRRMKVNTENDLRAWFERKKLS